MIGVWESRSLGEVVNFQRGLTYAKSDEVDVSENVVLRATNIDVTTNLIDLTELRYVADSVIVPPEKMVKRGSLLICTASGSRSHLGKVAFIDADYGFAFGGFMGQITPQDCVAPRYLFHLLTSPQYKEFIGGLSAGMNINNLKFDELKTFTVPLPPLSEQKRIVAVLDEAFEGIDAAKATAEQNRQNARAIFDNYVGAVFAQQGEGWIEATLDEVCGIASALVDPRLAPYRELPHIGAGNIESSTGALSDVRTAHEEGLISGKFPFDETMVLYSKIRPYLMKAARPDFVGLCSADIYPLAPHPKRITRDYLFHLLLSQPFTDYAMLGSARAGMPKVNRDHLFKFRTWLPGLDEQKRIATKIDDLHAETQRLDVCYVEKLDALAALKQSLLHHAFAGEL